MENVDKGLTVPKWVLILQPKIPQMPPICLPKPKSLGFSKRSSLWVSEVRGYMEEMASSEAQANSASTLGEFPDYLKNGWQLFFMFCNYKK